MQMEKMKQTMLQHEMIFKSQVRELHRLYWTQKNLMRELYKKQLEAKQSRVASSSKEGNVVSVEEIKGKFVEMSENENRGFNLELSPGGFVGYSGKNLISNGANADKNLHCNEVVIDLEDPKEMESRVKAHDISFNGFKVPAENCRLAGNLQLDNDNASDMASSSRVQNERDFTPYSSKKSGFVPDLNFAHADYCEESGAGGSESSAAGLVDVSTGSTHKQEPLPSRPMLIDLNVSQDDESSRTLNDPVLTFPSPSSSSSVVQNELLWRDQGNGFSKVVPACSDSRQKSIDWLFSGCHSSQRSKALDFDVKEDDEAGNNVRGSNSTGLTECCRNSPERLSGVSDGQLPSDIKGTAYVPVEETEKLSSGGLLPSRTSDGQQPSIVMADNITKSKQASHARSEEDTISSLSMPQDKKQQDGVDAKDLAGTRSTDESGTTQLDKDVESSPEKSGNTEDQQHDLDSAVVSAAEILAGIALTKSVPQYSTDTFETMTLELPEVTSGEHLTPTKPIEADAGEGTSGGNKLRRGRGRVVRDFQKDILPGIVSLSRHEIFEDMHSIGYELRKNGSRRGNVGNWFLPVRSRRSTRYTVGRRS